MNSAHGHYDIAVVGAGMVGAAAVCLLARSGFSVAVLEAREPAPFDPGAEVELRVSALSLGSASILEQCGAWQVIEQGRHCHYQQLWVEDESNAARLEFEAAAFGMERLGTIVENRLVQTSLWAAASSHALVDSYCPDGLAGISVDDDRVRLNLASGAKITAELVIGADGATSRVRTALGIGQDVWDYNQQGIVAVVGKSEPNPGVAWQRFMEGGPLAFLPLQDGRSSIVWTRPATEARKLLAMDDDSFAAALDAASEGWLGMVQKLGPRAAFPLTMRLSNRYAGKRAVLLGDAAHVVHPLAGQGVNIGLADAAALVEVLLDGRHQGRHPGDSTLLHRFDRWRRSESEVMAGGIHALRALFLPPALAGLRGLGLRLVARSWMAREMFLRRAAGLGRNAPQLARGASLKSLLRATSARS